MIHGISNINIIAFRGKNTLCKDKVAVSSPEKLVFLGVCLIAKTQTSHSMASRSISPFQVFLMVALIVFWASSFVVVKEILGDGLSPIAIATFRFLVAGAFFIASSKETPTAKL